MRTRQCGKRDDIVTALEERHNERRRSIGVTPSGGVVELFTSFSGTWSILVTTPQGITCIVSVGTDWEFIAPQPETQTH